MSYRSVSSRQLKLGNDMNLRNTFTFVCMMMGCLPAGCSSDGENTTQQPETPVASVSLSLVKTVAVVDDNTYRAATFPRIFENGTGGYHVFFHGVRADWDGQGPPTDHADFAAVTLDAELNTISDPKVLSLSSRPGDMAMAKVGDHYFHLSGYAPGWLLAKFDNNLNNVAEVSIEHTAADRANDMVLNYTNGNLYMMSLYGENMDMSPKIVDPIYGHLFVYDTSLAEVQAPKLLQGVEMLAWGGSILHQDGQFHVITSDGTHPTDTNVLSAYHFDESWNYTSATKLADDGQWPQGVVYDQGVYYVAYHEGSHGTGDVVVAAFDDKWSKLASLHVTQNGGKGNAFRPWLLKVGNTLLVSFDDVRFEGGDRPPMHAKVAAIEIELQ